MTFSEFIKHYTGKGLDWDGLHGFQCVDLYRYYVKEVVGAPQSPGVKGASNIWDTYLPDHFERIKNTPEGVPEPGDIVIWNNKAGGGFGHVGIFNSGDSATFKSFDQNWPVGSLCHLQKHTYENVLGWLRPKKKPVTQGVEPMIYKGLDLTNPESMKVAVDVWYRVTKGGEELILKEELDQLRSKSEELSKLKERLKNLDDVHAQELTLLKQKHQQEMADETLKLRSEVRTKEEEISNLKTQLLESGSDWKKRFGSRKFVLTCATALFDLAVAVAVLFGVKPDPMALAQVLTALHAVVAAFTLPEAFSDHQTRMALTNK